MSSTPETSITIRDARPTDAAQIAKFGQHVFMITYGNEAPAADTQTHVERFWSVSSFESDLANPKLTYVLATVGKEDKIIGFIQLTRGTTDPSIASFEKAVELQRLYIDPEYQGKGVARRLFEKVEGIAREEGFEHMWLGVWEHADWAQKVYERFGFRTVGSHPFPVGDEVHTDLVMVKKL